MEPEDFFKDLRTQFAVARAFEVLGEAAKRVLDSLSAEDPRIHALPLAKAYATRNRIIHGYESVLAETLWEIAQRDIPDLPLGLEELLAAWPV